MKSITHLFMCLDFLAFSLPSPPLTASCFALFSALPLWSSCDSVHRLMVEPGQCQPSFPWWYFTTSGNQAAAGMCFQDFPSQQLLLPQRMHLPNMLTFGKSVAVAVYVSQSKAWHQQMHGAMKRKELRTLKTIANPPLCPLHGFRKDFLSWEDWSS